jgi:hypothetical protein
MFLSCTSLAKKCIFIKAGVTIEVIKKDGDWWTGRMGDRVGVFPFNYVQPVEGEVS